MKTTAILLSFCFVLGGCVSKGKYDQAVATTQTTRAELDQTSSALRSTQAELDRTQNELDRTKAEINRLSAHGTENLARLDQLRKRLTELEAAQHAAEARAALFKQLTTKLRKQIDNGDLEITIRDGRMVLQLPNDVLFDTGRTELKPAGKSALEAVANVISSMPNRQFQVSGHTDNVPIHNAQFASNWELSAGRALRVVHFLVDKGASESSLSAAGYSEIDPVASNVTPEGRRKNRRTEITLQPNIDELVKVPE